MRTRNLGSFCFALLMFAATAVGCSGTKASGGGVGGNPAGCTDAPLDGKDWTPVGGSFVADGKDTCGRTVEGTFTIKGTGASLEKEIMGMQPASTWYMDADAETSCAQVSLSVGSPAGVNQPGQSLGGSRYGGAGYVSSSELAVALLFKNATAGCTVKVSKVHITQQPPAGMSPLPPMAGAPGPAAMSHR